MVFVIDGIQPNSKAQKTLQEIDDMTKFCGRKPEAVALFENQFDYLKRSCLLAQRRQVRAALKVENQGKRLKPGALQQALEQKGFEENQSANLISWQGITLYNKNQDFQKGAVQC